MAIVYRDPPVLCQTPFCLSEAMTDFAGVAGFSFCVMQKGKNKSGSPASSTRQGPTPHRTYLLTSIFAQPELHEGFANGFFAEDLISLGRDVDERGGDLLPLYADFCAVVVPTYVENPNRLTPEHEARQDCVNSSGTRDAESFEPGLGEVVLIFLDRFGAWPVLIGEDED